MTKKITKPAATSKKTAAKKAPAKKAAPVSRQQGIGAFCKDLIAKGRTNEQVLAAVMKKFPTAQTSLGSIAWYRCKI